MHEMPALLLPSEQAVRRFVVEWIRNRLAYLPGATVLLPDGRDSQWMHEWWTATEHAPGRVVAADRSRATSCDFAVLDKASPVRTDADGQVATTVRCIDALVLPGGDSGAVAAAAAVLELRTGVGSGNVLLVPGTSRGPAGRLTPAAIDRLRHAEAVARGGGVRAVVVSGWGGPDAHETEAYQLLQAWAGPPVPVIADPAARTTAENGVCCARLLAGLPDVREVILITSWSNALRQHLLARTAFRGTRIAVRSLVLWGRLHATSLRPGLLGILRMRRHLRAGEALLRYGRDDPRSKT